MRETMRAAALHAALAPSVARRSFWVAVVVGTVLNAINQGDMLLEGAAVNWFKVALTYAVPFCVATYGAYGACRDAVTQEWIVGGRGGLQ